MAQSAIAQKNFTLHLRDVNSKEPLIGAYVLTKDKSFVSDENGICKFQIDKFPTKLNISYIGYDNLTYTLTSQSDESIYIDLSPKATTLDLITVTGSKYEQNIATSPVSIDIIKSDIVSSTNTLKADVILNKIPGVQVIDGQANIRGGSGFSYGAGSRVMLLIDDIPALQPDAGFPNWGDIPIENLSQIEILKGAASTLYGSAALNGIINYRTAYAKSNPETHASAAFTVFDSPKDTQKKWWGDTLRYSTNASFVHKEKYGKLDFVGSGFYTKLEGFNQFTNESRGRGNINLRYRLSEKFILGINTIANFSKSNSFFIWGGPVSKAMQAFPGTVSDKKARRLYLDPTMTYYDNFGNSHKLLSRWTSIKNDNNTNQSNYSKNGYIEYQYQRKFAQLNLNTTSGVVWSGNKTESQILGDTIFSGRSFAWYLQADKKFFEKLIVNGGIRFEHNRQVSPINFLGTQSPKVKQEGRWVSRFSINYELHKYTNFRASWGQGYRFPTLTERFVTTTFGSFSIFSNPFLGSEFGWSAETGLKQGFKLAAFKGFIDVSGFVSAYENMIEFTFVSDVNHLGFQPQNVGNTQIFGTEISIIGQVAIGKVDINILTGYTYLDPKYKNWDTDEGIRNSVSGEENVLKYRSKHQFKSDTEAKYKKYKLGLSYQRVSHVINVDRAFESVPPINFDVFGIKEYRQANNNGYSIVDIRIGVDFSRVSLTGIVSNVFNTEYTLRPALMEAPRNFTLRADFKL